MSNPRILAFAGSARRDSLNRRLLVAAAAFAREAGADVTVADLADYPMPLFDQDLEAEVGRPDEVARFRGLMLEHDGFLIAAPEYNSSITPLLKNTIDWASRSLADEPPLECFRGKTCGLLAASPGALGGLRGLVHVRAILSNIGVLVIPEQHALGSAHEAFDDDGGLSDERAAGSVERVANRLVAVTAALSRRG